VPALVEVRHRGVRLQQPVDRGVVWAARQPRPPRLGLHPIVTLQYSSTTLSQFSYHIR
jgi:hypothetical protein